MSRAEPMLMLDLSLSHLSEATAVRIMGPGLDGVISYPKIPYGAFVHVARAPDEIDDASLPDDLQRCLALARRQGCDWIMFDVDGSALPDLPVHPGH